MINYTIQNLSKLAAKASLLFMSLLIMSADNQCFGSVNPEDVVFKLKVYSALVNEKEEQAPIRVRLTVKKGTVDPTQWTITTKDLIVFNGIIITNVKLTCSEENKKLSDVGITEPIIAGTSKEFTIKLEADPKKKFDLLTFNSAIGYLIVKSTQGDAQVTQQIGFLRIN